METLTIVLLVCVGVFAIGNILLYILEKKTQKLPVGNATTEVISSKIDVLNKRLSKLELNKNEIAKDIIFKKPKKIIQKKQISRESKRHPITEYKKKKKRI